METIKEKITNLILALMDSEIDLANAVPHAAFAVRGKLLSNLPKEDRNLEVMKLVNSMELEIPEEKREESLTKFSERLEEALRSLVFTKSRIDFRTQPEGVERVQPEFRSFCKRKKLKEW